LKFKLSLLKNRYSRAIDILQKKIDQFNVQHLNQQFKKNVTRIVQGRTRTKRKDLNNIQIITM